MNLRKISRNFGGLYFIFEGFVHGEMFYSIDARDRSEHYLKRLVSRHRCHLLLEHIWYR